jgi:hypothetical protein
MAAAFDVWHQILETVRAGIVAPVDASTGQAIDRG